MILPNNVIDKIKESDWFSPVVLVRYADVIIDHSAKYIKQFTFSGLFITKNNKEIYGQMYSCAVVSFKDIEDRSKKYIENLKTARRDSAYRLLIWSLKNVLRYRTGIRGHRGRFKIVDIIPKG